MIIITIIVITRVITNSLRVSGRESINVSDNIIETLNLSIANFNNTVEQTNDPPENRDDNNSFSKNKRMKIVIRVFAEKNVKASGD